ncbi:DUF4406 domain-containing protein [Lancefieldella rimae]
MMGDAKADGAFEGKWCFVSGAVSGIEDRNKAAFDAVEKWLRKEGAKVVFNPVAVIDADKSWEDAMRVCLHVLTENKYDVLVCLPDSSISCGSTLEQAVAMSIGTKVLTLDQIALDEIKAQVGAL